LSIEEIDKKIEGLQKRKMELLVKAGEAFKCKKCGKITMKSPISSRYEKEGLCYECWSKEVRQRKQKKLLKMLSQARIVDVEPVNNPFFDISDVNKIVIEVDGERYEIKGVPYGNYIEIKRVE